MPPKKKTNPLFIPAKTLPGRSGRGPVIPTNNNTKYSRDSYDLQEKGWVDKEKLAELDRERERRGLPNLKKKNGETKAETEEKEKKEEEEKESEPEPEPEQEPRFTAETKGKGKTPTLQEQTTTKAATEAPVLPETSLVEEESTAGLDDEQNELLWKLIGFFNSALPLPPSPPATPPTTIAAALPTPTKAVPVLSVPSVSSSPPPPPLSPPSTSLSDPSATPTDDNDADDDKWESMSFGWGDDDPMWQSGWDFPHKPTFSIYEPNPWKEPNHELNTIMTVEVEDGAFDVAQWVRDLYDANVEPAATCKFEHPANRQSANPFAPLQSSLQSNTTTRGSTAADFYLNRDAIQKDLQDERPEWILSAYGPGRDAPEQLWGGFLEQSPEEMRLHAMTCEAANNLQRALSDFEMLKSKAVEKIGAAYNDPDAAINWIMSALNKQPNRLSLVANNMNGEFAVGKRPVGFGQSPAFSMPPTNASPFSQPSAPAQNANPFTSGTSGFGQPSALGQVSNAFSQPAAMGPGTGFGQASALGQKTSAFGAPSALGTQSAFSQGTGFGQASALGPKSNPFGASPSFAQPSQTTQANAFGQPSQLAQGSPFGQPSQLGAKPSPFSNASASAAPAASPFSAFANKTPSGNAFAPVASSTNNAFAQNSQQTSSPFGQPQQAPSNEVSMDSISTPSTNAFAAADVPVTTANPFGQPQQNSTAFGQPSSANPFTQAKQPAFGQPAEQRPNPFASAAVSSSQPASQPASSTVAPTGPSTNGPYGPNASRQHPALSGYAVKDPATGQLRSFKGRPVLYRESDGKPTPHVQNMDGTFTKIWFPDGAPQYYQDTEPDREHTDAEKTLWQHFQQTGKFQLAANGGGGMPSAPPMRESVQWDF